MDGARIPGRRGASGSSRFARAMERKIAMRHAIGKRPMPCPASRVVTARRRSKLSARDKAQHPAGRVGTPEDIGQLAVVLLGPDAGFVTGQEFIVDGGMTRKMQYA